MILILSPELKKIFSEDSYGFDKIMGIRGEVFRALENRCTQRIDLDEKSYFIKQHFGIGWKEILKNLFQGRLPILSAKNEWRAIAALHLLNVKTMTVAGYGCRGKNPAKLQSFLITHALPKTISLEDLSKSWGKTEPLFAQKLRLIEEVASITRTLHENGINHRDLYICHFLLDLKTLHLYLIDLHRAQIRKQIPFRWQVKDLAGLYFSTKNIGLSKRDLLRFMKIYRNKPLRDVLTHEINLWKKVEQRGDKLYRKHE